MPGEQIFFDSTASPRLVQKYKQLKKKIKESQDLRNMNIIKKSNMPQNKITLRINLGSVKEQLSCPSPALSYDSSTMNDEYNSKPTLNFDSDTSESSLTSYPSDTSNPPVRGRTFDRQSLLFYTSAANKKRSISCESTSSLDSELSISTLGSLDSISPSSPTFMNIAPTPVTTDSEEINSNSSTSSSSSTSSPVQKPLEIVKDEVKQEEQQKQQQLEENPIKLKQIKTEDSTIESQIKEKYETEIKQIKKENISMEAQLKQKLEEVVQLKEQLKRQQEAAAAAATTNPSTETNENDQMDEKSKNNRNNKSSLQEKDNNKNSSSRSSSQEKDRSNRSRTRTRQRSRQRSRSRSRSPYNNSSSSSRKHSRSRSRSRSYGSRSHSSHSSSYTRSRSRSRSRSKSNLRHGDNMRYKDNDYYHNKKYNYYSQHRGGNNRNYYYGNKRQKYYEEDTEEDDNDEEILSTTNTIEKTIMEDPRKKPLLDIEQTQIYRESARYLETEFYKKTIYLGDLEENTPESVIHQIFSGFGEIREIKIFPGKQYAFISYKSAVSALEAIKKMNGYQLGKSIIKVGKAKIPERNKYGFGNRPWQDDDGAMAMTQDTYGYEYINNNPNQSSSVANFSPYNIYGHRNVNIINPRTYQTSHMNPVDPRANNRTLLSYEDF